MLSGQDAKSVSKVQTGWNRIDSDALNYLEILRVLADVGSLLCG